MVKKKTEKKRIDDFYKLEHITEIKSDSFEEGSYKSKISSEKNKQGYEGIRVQSASTKPYFKTHKLGFWIPNRINLSEWFKWFSRTVKGFAYKIIISRSFFCYSIS